MRRQNRSWPFSLAAAVAVCVEPPSAAAAAVAFPRQLETESCANAVFGVGGEGASSGAAERKMRNEMWGKRGK